jgi:hypothetical protein
MRTLLAAALAGIAAAPVSASNDYNPNIAGPDVGQSSGQSSGQGSPL